MKKKNKKNIATTRNFGDLSKNTMASKCFPIKFRC